MIWDKCKRDMKRIDWAGVFWATVFAGTILGIGLNFAWLIVRYINGPLP